MKTKSMPASLAPLDDEAPHFEAIVSVFDNKDFGGDIVRPGAFADSIAAWKSADAPIPVYWSHRIDDPTYNIGEVVDIAELPGGDPKIPDWANEWVKSHGGLWVKAALDTHGMAGQVRHLMKHRRVKQFSFMYDVLEERQSKDGNELLKLALYEVGPTPLGMNPLTELIGAKNADPPPEETTETAERPRKRAFLFDRLAEAQRWLTSIAD